MTHCPAFAPQPVPRCTLPRQQPWWRHAVCGTRALKAGGGATSGSVTLGLDFGTSGARVMAVDATGTLVADARTPWPANGSDDWPAAWETALWELLTSLPSAVRAQVRALALDGTSATCLLVDATSGAPLTQALLYNAACTEALPAVAALAPKGHTCVAATSTLAKLMTWHTAGRVARNAVLAHQADHIAALLHGRVGVSDWNNALKLGFDPEASAWPPWLIGSQVGHALPRAVVRPGACIGPLTPAAASRAGLPADCVVAAGTTDSIAAFLASFGDGAAEMAPGDAVTSLGSTLAVKMLSRTRIDDAVHGIYSHRIGDDTWLVGGASNTGGAVLKALFGDSDKLRTLSARIIPGVASPLDYYPLNAPGERFPVNDAKLEPRLSPRPADEAEFLHGVLESRARIEARGYQLLAAQGAPPLRRVLTAGGGGANEQWVAIRQRLLGVPVSRATQGEAAYGAALLARQALL